MTVYLLATSILLGAALLVALLVLLASWWLEEQYGPVVAQALLGYTVLRLVAVGLIVTLILGASVWAVPPASWHWLTLLAGGLGLLGLGGLAWLWRRARAACGTVLLDLGHIGKENRQVVRSIGILGAGLLVAGLVAQDAVWFLQGLYLLALARGQTVYDRAPLLLTERGIYAPEGSVHWSQVRSAEWLDGTHRVAVLFLTTRRVIFNRQVVRVPWEALDDVDAILVAHLAEPERPEAKPSPPPHPIC